MTQVRRLGGRTIYANPWLTLHEDEVAFADGSTGIFAFVEKRDFAMVIPYQDGGFWLVQQFRYAVGRREWEFPQGGWPAERDGTPEELAAAELAEETGLCAARLDHLGRLNSAPGHASNAFVVFLATGLTGGEPCREPSEADMRHAFFPEQEVRTMVRRGEFRDSHSVAALALLDLHRRG